MPLIVLLLAVALQIFLTSRKISPFISLLLVAVLAGLSLGMDPSAVLASVEKGVASTLGGLALIICLGAILGKALEDSGAASRIVVTLIRVFGERNIQWAALTTGFLVGLPLYYNAGFIILVPIIFTMVRKTQLPLLYVAMPVVAALSTTHCFLPPHPGPVVLVKAFNADVGKTLIYGLIMAVPAVIIAGPLFGRFLKRLPVTNTLETVDGNVQSDNDQQTMPPPFPSFFLALLPVLIITLSVLFGKQGGAENAFGKIVSFLGDPAVALFITVLLAIVYFGIIRRKGTAIGLGWVQQGISGVAVILMIIGAGGVFKQVLTDSGIGDYIVSYCGQWNMHPLLFAWLLTAILRVAMGSATVAGLTAAGIVLPLIGQTDVSPELLVLAVGAGSVFGSHINDSGFWMFKEYFGLTLKQTFLSWTIMESIVSLVGLIMVLLLNLIV
jgi:Gnt-I system high-affinity gluconate transporter